MAGEQFVGFKFHVIGNRLKEGGLPLNAGIRTCLAYSDKAVSMGFRMDPQLVIEDVRQNARTEALTTMSLGGKVGDANGVATILCDES